MGTNPTARRKIGSFFTWINAKLPGKNRIYFPDLPVGSDKIKSILYATFCHVYLSIHK